MREIGAFAEGAVEFVSFVATWGFTPQLTY